MKCSTFIHKFGKLVESAVSLFAFSLAVGIVIYMLSAFGLGMWNFFSDLPHILSVISSADYSSEAMSERHHIETALLHTFAFAVLLIKIYKILISYARTHHLNIKFLVEIAIIAPTIEILFNFHAYSLGMLILLAVFGVANLLIYVWNYEQFKKIGQNDHERKNS